MRSSLLCDALTTHGVELSHNRPYVAWGNAVAESAFSSLANEFYHHYSFDTRQDARRDTIRYIVVFCNRWGPHTHNEGLPPAIAMANFNTQNRQQLVAV